MIPHATIRAIADEVIAQITMGCKAYRSGDLLSGDLYMSLGRAALERLQRLIDADAPPKPLRVLAIVGPRDEDGDPIPDWMQKRHGDPTDAA